MTSPSTYPLKEKAMASLSLNSLPLPPSSQHRKLVETSLPHGCLKPIVVSGNPPTFVSAPGRRIVAVGDLHGDLAQARCAFEIAGVLSSDGQDLWTGGETVLIQLGDILDRGEDEIAILSLLRSLDIQAKAKGGAVFQVNGNHETMNVEGDFRYVDPGAFDECVDFMEYLDDHEGNWDKAFLSWASAFERWKEDRRMPPSQWGPWNLMKRQKGVIARSILLRPGGPLACELARHAVVLKVNDWVFCHGGLLPHHVAYGIERMNREVSFWMRGLSESDKTLQAVAIHIFKYNCNIWRIDVGMSSGDSVWCCDSQLNLFNGIKWHTRQAPILKGRVIGHMRLRTGSGDSCLFIEKRNVREMGLLFAPSLHHREGSAKEIKV
ncbi:hypothetical protein HHK36_016105 [Tetracentron sinense]|uniref:Calcineurin-like phosphoesterase domain-containing protein n=1 Tax=Tetracentron sinense TaxID=13715 RepID=A0A835DB70_TETSI|nr:hypothetical protein HHK36_016105 [Tetracentron sinense]